MQTMVQGADMVRSRHMKLFLGRVDALESRARSSFYSAMPTEDVALVHDSSPTLWLPLDLNVRATEIIWHALGADAREAFFVRLGVADCESSLLNATLASAMRLFGVDPGRMLKWTPRVWSQLYRDTTRVTVFDVAAGSLRVAFDDLPPRAGRSLVWMQSVASSMCAIFEITKRTGAASLEVADHARRRMVLHYRWQNALTKA